MKIPILFEFVIYHMLVNSSFKWSVCKDGQNWEDCHLKFSSSKSIAKYEQEVLKNMQTDVLYHTVNPKFPVVDMLWVEENEPGQRVYFGIQVTLDKSHGKNTTADEDLYDCFTIN